MSDETILPMKERELRLRVRKCPDLQSMLVSRRFRRELLERAMDLTHLIIEDSKDYGGEGPVLPRWLRDVPCIELHLVVMCDWSNHTGECAIRNELNMHRLGVMDFLVGLQNLRSFSLNVYLDRHCRVQECEHALLKYQSRLLSDVANIDRLTTFNVYRYHISENYWEFSGEKTLVVKYSHNANELQRVHPKVTVSPDTDAREAS